MAKQQHSRGFRARILGIALSAVVALLGIVALTPASSAGTSNPEGSFSIALDHGESQLGYRWSVGAKGKKSNVLKSICATLSMTEPPRDDAPYSEGSDATDCGPLRHPEESIRSSVSMGRRTSTSTVIAILYRPIVAKVRVDLGSGPDKVVRPKLRRVAEKEKGSIPLFRFLALALEGDVCVKRIVSYDDQGGVVKSERPEGSMRCLISS